MRIPWWTFLRVSAQWELGRLLRAAARAPEPREPGLPPLAAAEAEESQPAFTVPEEARLRALSDWLWCSSGGTRGLGEDLADRLQRELPAVPSAALATVLLSLAGFVEETEAEYISAADALIVVKDALCGAAPIIAAAELGAEPERGRRR